MTQCCGGCHLGPTRGMSSQLAASLLPTPALQAVLLREGSTESCTLDPSQLSAFRTLAVGFTCPSFQDCSCPFLRSSQSTEEVLKLVKHKRQGIKGRVNIMFPGASAYLPDPLNSHCFNTSKAVGLCTVIKPPKCSPYILQLGVVPDFLSPI